MRKIIYFSIAVFMFSLPAQAKITAYVSILPQKYFAEKIVGNKIDVQVMVMPGASPATYEPKPKQMVELSKTDLYFSIGVPFENTWLEKFQALNKNMKIIHTDKGIKKIQMAKHVHNEEEDHHKADQHHEDEDHADEHGEHGEHDEHGEHSHSEGTPDPHIWLDPILVYKSTVNMTNALCEFDMANCTFYRNNLKKFKDEIDILNSDLKNIVTKAKAGHFMVFHPSWGYFAERYGLHQIPVELEGKEPKPSDLKDFIVLVKKLKLNVIFIQPQFSKKAAKLIAKETGVQMVAVDPLSENWRENLVYAAKLISGSIQPAK